MTGLLWKETFFLLSYFVQVDLFQPTAKSSGPIELCQWKTLNETCPAGSVVMVEHALYGRMRFGRCVDRDFGHQGCSVSVLSYIERRCAGRRRCVLSLPDEYLDQLEMPCPKDLKSYLELSYHCVEVESGESQICRGVEVKASAGRSGYLSNFVTEETNLGSASCPWVVEGRPGQRLTLTLADFAVWSKEGDASRVPIKTGLCQIYAKIREATESPAGGGGVIVCGGEHREQLVYTSETNIVHVEITDPKTGSNPVYFLLKYEITGCGDYVPHSTEAVVERLSDRALIVRCPHDDLLTFELRCEADQWVGRVQNCSDEWKVASIWNIGGMIARPGTMSRDAVVMVIGVIAVLVAMGVLAIGILFIRRRRNGRRSRRRRQKLTSEGGEVEVGAGSIGVIDAKLTSDPTYNRYREHYPMLLKADGFSAGGAAPGPHRILTEHVTVGATRLPPPADPPLTPSNSSTVPEFYCFPNDGPFLADPDDLYSIKSAAVGNREEVEHIYESPKFFRRPRDDDDDDDNDEDGKTARQGSLYHELDRNSTSNWTSVS